MASPFLQLGPPIARPQGTERMGVSVAEYLSRGVTPELEAQARRWLDDIAAAQRPSLELLRMVVGGGCCDEASHPR